jgi:DNA polymerase-1
MARPRKTPKYGDSEKDLRRAIAQYGSVAVDLETTGLKFHADENSRIGAAIFSAGGKPFVLRELPDWWPEVLADPDTRVIGHNLSFDLAWMIQQFPEDTAFIRNTTDTMIQSQLLHDYRTRMGAIKAGFPGKWQPNDLKSVLAERLDVSIAKEIDHETTDWTGPWSPEMIDYMLEDIVHLEKLADIQDSLLMKQGQERANWIEQRTVPATAWMSYNGLKPDLDLWREKIPTWVEDRDHMLWHLIRSWPSVKNFRSPKQLMAAADTDLGFPIPDTKKATLKALARGGSYKVKQLLDFRLIQKRLENWGETFLTKYTCGVCSRFHPNWRQIGTETSRFSCSGPNLQQIPRAAEFRRMFVAEEGFRFASLDYSSIEVVTAAVRSGDAALLEACRTGDPHRAVAAQMLGIEFDSVTEEQRQGAKILNFGLLFGGGVNGYIRQARDIFDVDIDPQKAEQDIKGYFRHFMGMAILRQKAYRATDVPEPRLESINAVGFRRYLEGRNRKSTSILNSDIQSTAGYGFKSSFPYMMEAGLLPFLCGQVHDEVLAEFPDDDAPYLRDSMVDCMRRGMTDVLGANAPVKIDAKVAMTW